MKNNLLYFVLILVLKKSNLLYLDTLGPLALEYEKAGDINNNSN